MRSTLFVVHRTLCLGRPRAVFLAVTTLIVTAQVVFTQAPPPQPPKYTIKNLGTLCVPKPELGCELADSFALDVNNWGQVVGTSSLIRTTDGFFLTLVPSAFRTSAGQPINPATDRLDHPGLEGIAFAINDGGQVVGSVTHPFLNTVRAFIFTGSGPMMFLPGLIACSSFAIDCNEAFGINNSGAVVGSAHAASAFPPEWHAFRLTSVVQDLGGFQSAAYDINDFGLAVGLSHDVGLNQRAVVFGGLSPLSLGTLGGSECDSCDSVAYGVNNGGAPDPTTPTTARIVGQSSLTPMGPRHAFVFQLGPGSLGMQDLGTLCAEGDCDSTAFDINDLGHIVGESEIAPGLTRAFLYKNNQMTDLNNLLGATDQALWDLIEARAINDFGQIAGTGQGQGKTRAFLMTPPLGFIFDNVSQLVAVSLSSQASGTKQSLLATLQAAQEAIERGQREVAGVQLNAYEQQVRAQVEGRQLTEIQGNKLLAGAGLIRRVMEEEGRR